MENPKIIYFIAIAVGGTAFSFIPALWGSSSFSIAGILLSAVGGLLALWLAYKWVNG